MANKTLVNTGNPRQQGAEFLCPLSLSVSEKGVPKAGETVKVFLVGNVMPVYSSSTAVDGELFYDVRVPASKGGSTVKVRVQVGADFEKEVEFALPRAKTGPGYTAKEAIASSSQGWFKSFLTALGEVKAFCALHSLWTAIKLAVLFLITYIFGATGIVVVMAVIWLINVVIDLVKKPSEALKALNPASWIGLAFQAGAFLAVLVLVNFKPGIILHPLYFAAWATLLIGEPCFWLEEIINKQKGKEVASTYPKIPMLVGVLMIIIKIGFIASGFSSGEVANDFSDVSGEMSESSFDMDDSSSSSGWFSFFGLSFGRVADIVDWLVYFIVLSAISLPGEFMSKYKKHKADGKSGNSDGSSKLAAIFSGFDLFAERWHKGGKSREGKDK